MHYIQYFTCIAVYCYDWHIPATTEYKQPDELDPPRETDDRVSD